PTGWLGVEGAPGPPVRTVRLAGRSRSSPPTATGLATRPDAWQIDEVEDPEMFAFRCSKSMRGPLRHATCVLAALAAFACGADHAAPSGPAATGAGAASASSTATAATDGSGGGATSGAAGGSGGTATSSATTGGGNGGSGGGGSPDAGPPIPSAISDRIDWPAFFARHDLVWTALPTGWSDGAFIGNGLVGAMVSRDGATANAIRWRIGRTDIYDARP